MLILHDADLTELKKCPPPSVHLQYDSNEARPTLYIRIETSSENHIYPRQTVRFYIPVSDSYPRERPFVYCEPPIYHPFINQATGVVSLEDIEKHFQFVQNQVINNDSFVIRSLNSPLNMSGSTTPVSSPSKLSNSTSSIMNTNNNNTLSVEKIERLTASLEIAAKATNDEICDENITNRNNFDQELKILPTIIEHPPITITTTNTNQTNQNAPNTPSTPVSSSPQTPSTPSSSTSSTSNSSNFSSPFCSPYRSEGQNVLKSVVDALQNLFVDTSYLTNYMNF